MNNDASTSTVAPKWLHPNEVLKRHRLKLKQKQLQARIINKKSVGALESSPTDDGLDLDGLSNALKRRNPFINDKSIKRQKSEESLDEVSKVLPVKNLGRCENYNGVIPRALTDKLANENIESNVQVGTPWIPIDWSLKSKVRLLSTKPFAWNQKLKISEEASGITGFVRCLDHNSETTLDTSPNSKFHQCCLFWQQPSLPWLNLFPRTVGRTSLTNNIGSVALIRESLQHAWSNSFRSLFQLVRTRQCPYFYMCGNTFTALFRAAGIGSCSEMNAMVTPTTRGFRQLLQQEDVVFKMPLKGSRLSNENVLQNNIETDEEDIPNERWLENMGINADEIKKINLTQDRIVCKAECNIDNSNESVILIEGMEVQGLYNFLMNSKSITSLTGPTAGIPPTLLAPVAFHGATLSSLKVRENKVRDDKEYFSLELNGPILPQLIHNLCLNHPSDQDFTATFANVNSTLSFSKVQIEEQNDKENKNRCGVTVFGQENLSDSGLNVRVLKHFCSANSEKVYNVECLKYSSETQTYTWF